MPKHESVTLKLSRAKVGQKVIIYQGSRYGYGDKDWKPSNGTIIQKGNNWYLVEYRHKKNGLGETKSRVYFNRIGEKNGWTTLAHCYKAI